jgi:histidine ammonia-lyase
VPPVKDAARDSSAAPATASITVGAAPLVLDDIVRIARERASVAFADAARARVEAARAFVLQQASGPTPVYGLNSALGANTGARLAAADLADYQRRAVRARAVGVGPRYGVPTVRAMLAARLAGMAAGGSGVSSAVVDGLLALLNRGVHPCVPRHGSIGAADLPQLAHLALPLIGEGEADFDGARLPGAEALARAGLQPVTLGPKDGLALVSANAATLGRAALALHDARTLAMHWIATVALSFEGFRANPSILDPRAIAARAAPGQAEVAADLRALLDEGTLTPATARRVQDPLSFRVVAPVHGAGRWMLGEAIRILEMEINCAADSPLVAPDGALLSNGNFQMPALALALDALAIALAQMASLAAGRVLRFMSPALTDLPLQLTLRGPAHSGFATLQKTTVALLADIRHRANPASLDFLPVSESVEDHATMTLATVEKLMETLDRVRYLIAIEQVVAAQAIDLRGLRGTDLGRGARALHRAIRAEVTILDEDRPLGPDIERRARSICALTADDERA